VLLNFDFGVLKFCGFPGPSWAVVLRGSAAFGRGKHGSTDGFLLAECDEKWERPQRWWDGGL
jgi:hypothetical protein